MVPELLPLLLVAPRQDTTGAGSQPVDSVVPGTSPGACGTWGRGMKVAGTPLGLWDRYVPLKASSLPLSGCGYRSKTEAAGGSSMLQRLLSRARRAKRSKTSQYLWRPMGQGRGESPRF